MRANQALSEDSHIFNVSSLDREVNRARGLLSNVNAEADMERSAHRETMDALDASENTVSFGEIVNQEASKRDLFNIIDSLYYFFYWCACTKPLRWEVMYLCVRGIDFASFYDFSIVFRNCSYCVVFFVFYFIILLFSVLDAIMQNHNL